MSLSLALNSALSGLNVNQRSLATLSQNIANANNPEYSRKIVTQEAVYLQGTGAGVSISDIGRRVDEYLQKSVRGQGSVAGRAQVLSDYSDRLQTLLGNPGSQNSIYSYTTSFFNTLQSLSQTPENAALRVNAASSAKNMAQQMQSLAQGVYDLQFAADLDIKRSIDAINSNLRDIYALNVTIGSDKLLGRSTSELEDKRDSMLKELSGMLDIQTYEQTSGVLNVFTSGGQNLIDTNLYQLSYNSVNSADFFANGNSTSAINVYRVDERGGKTGTPNILVTAGTGDGVTTNLVSGKLKGLLEIRDQQLPDVLEKLDMLASTIRDEINAVHNSGSAYPGSNSYTGTRLLGGEDYSQWSGQVRIAVLDQNGQPVPSTYSDEASGARPLLLDLGSLNTGAGAGYPTVQGIISAINQYYGVPQNKVELGNLNDIRLVLNNDSIPGATPQLNFDFKLDNMSGTDAPFFISDIQVFDDTDANITSITQNVPSLALSSTNTYTTTAGSNVVAVKTASNHSYHAGDVIYLSAPSSSVDGMPADALEGYFIISNITANGFEISAKAEATSGGAFSRSGVESRSAYATAATGTNDRTTASGTITANIASSTSSRFYTVKASVATVDADGKISKSVVTYRIDNLQTNVRNYAYAAQSATNDGTIVTPNSTKPLMVAKLVDEKGNELPIVNNQYTTALKGYLKLEATNGSYVIAIDSMDSSEGGKPNSVPVVLGSNRGFSHFFELNNLFKANRSSTTLDEVKGSAARMGVSDAITSNVNLISLGNLKQSPRPVDTTKPPLYTYERAVGDNSAILKLAAFSTNIVSFGAAGDLGPSSLSISAYAGQLISTTSAKSSSNKADMDNANLLLQGFRERADGVRGVNLDEELANTIIYQNAYSASARIITVANQFFDALMEAMR